MAVTFLEPGGDADFLLNIANGFWGSTASGASIATDFVHGGHIKSVKYAVGGYGGWVSSKSGSASDAGTRVSFYAYFNALPAASTATILWITQAPGASTPCYKLKLTTAGALQLTNSSNAQIGSNGSTLSTGIWYRISLAYTVSSTSVNSFRVFVNGTSSISATNATLVNISSGAATFGNVDSNGGLDMRSSDHYVDSSASLADPGNIWVTAKRPVSNGTANNFTTQIGSGGSGYGTGHSPQVNERPLNTANGWSIVAVGATTEEYNIEGKSVGDINISSATIVDYAGWVSAKALLSETASIIVNNAASNIALTSTIALFTAVAGSSSYPAGTGTDIGITTSATATTVSLYECGIIVAYIPAAASLNSGFMPFV